MITGLRRRTDERRHYLAATRPYHAAGALLQPATVIQPVFRLHDQPEKPSCVGETYASGAEHVAREALSGVDLWLDARRRQGDLANPDVGTDSEHAIESVIKRGFSRYRAGEETRPEALDVQIPDLQAETEADARRIQVAAEHRTILIDRAVRMVDGLIRGYTVGFGGGVRDAYSAIGVNQIVGVDCYGGDQGHEQRAAGWIHPDDDGFPASWRGCFFTLSSWKDHGGILLPCDVRRSDGVLLTRGTLLRQLILTRPEVFESAGIWDVDAIEMVFA